MDNAVLLLENVSNELDLVRLEAYKILEGSKIHNIVNFIKNTLNPKPVTSKRASTKYGSSIVLT